MRSSDRPFPALGDRAAGLVRVVVLTLALGATVVVSWTVARGLSVFSDRDPGPFLDPSWFLIWAVQAGLAGLVGLIGGRAWGRETSDGSLIRLVMLAWVGELLVVTLLTPLLAGDGQWRPFQAVYIWFVATGGPIQPLAAIIGTLVGKSSTRALTTRTAD